MEQFFGEEEEEGDQFPPLDCDKMWEAGESECWRKGGEKKKEQTAFVKTVGRQVSKSRQIILHSYPFLLRAREKKLSSFMVAFV